MQSPRLLGHVILCAGLGLALLIAGVAWSYPPDTRPRAESPYTARSRPLPVNRAGAQHQLGPAPACLAAGEIPDPRARQR